jgi:hypothetical protein
MGKKKTILLVAFVSDMYVCAVTEHEEVCNNTNLF